MNVMVRGGLIARPAPLNILPDLRKAEKNLWNWQKKLTIIQLCLRKANLPKGKKPLYH
jgi:hypothetical protein